MEVVEYDLAGEWVGGDELKTFRYSLVENAAESELL